VRSYTFFVSTPSLDMCHSTACFFHYYFHIVAFIFVFFHYYFNNNGKIEKGMCRIAQDGMHLDVV